MSGPAGPRARRAGAPPGGHAGPDAHRGDRARFGPTGHLTGRLAAHGRAGGDRARWEPLGGDGPRPDGAPQGRVFLTGILASRADFERARPWGLADAPDYDAYLADTAAVLAEAHQTFEVVRARVFHPGDFEDFCLLHRCDPAESGSRDRYLVNPPLQAQLLPYQGEELVEDFIPRLVRARENGLTLCHIDLLLDGVLHGVGPVGDGGADGPRVVREAHRRATEVFRRMLVGAGHGVYEFRCALEAPGGPLEAAAGVLHWEDGVVRINDEDLDLVCAVLCAGLALGLPGVALLYGSQGAPAQAAAVRGGAAAGAPGASADRAAGHREAAWAWRSDGPGWLPAAGGSPASGAGPGFSLGTVC